MPPAAASDCRISGPGSSSDSSSPGLFSGRGFADERHDSTGGGQTACHQDRPDPPLIVHPCAWDWARLRGPSPAQSRLAQCQAHAAPSSPMVIKLSTTWLAQSRALGGEECPPLSLDDLTETFPPPRREVRGTNTQMTTPQEVWSISISRRASLHVTGLAVFWFSNFDVASGGPYP